MAKYWYYLKSIFELLFGFKNWPTVFKVFLNISKTSPLIVRLKNPAIAMLVRGKMDIWSIKETFIDRFYSRYGCELQNGWTVVDIGAAIGEFSIFAACGRPNTRVIAYEPFEESIQLLRENLGLNQIENVVVIPRAVWKTSSRITLDLSHQEPLKITSGSDLPERGRDTRISVQADSLKDVLKTNKLAAVDLVKLDCEGAEFEILLESDAETVRAFKRMVMEYHEALNGRQHSQLVSRLEQLGYRVVARSNVVHPDIGYLYAEQIR